MHLCSLYIIHILSFFTVGGTSPSTKDQRAPVHVLENRYLKVLELAKSVLTIEINKNVQSAPQQKLPQNCYDLLQEGKVETGIETVYPYKQYPNWGVEVLCDQKTHNGGWTVIQSRDDIPQKENFHRTRNEYLAGFGNLTEEFWLGLENIHALTNSNLMEILIDMEDKNGREMYAKYDYLQTSNRAIYVNSWEFYLKIGNYSGDSEDGIWNQKNMRFSTDEKHGNCGYGPYRANSWWFNNDCEKQPNTNLNGYHLKNNDTEDSKGFNWSPRDQYIPLKKSRMLIRPVVKYN